MTTPINERLAVQQDQLQLETKSQAKNITLLSQKQIETKQLLEGLFAKYPLTSKVLEEVAAQNHISASNIEKTEKAQQDAEIVANKGKDLIEQFQGFLNNADASCLIVAFEKDLLNVCQEQKRLCEQLKKKVDERRFALEQLRAKRLGIEAKLNKL